MAWSPVVNANSTWTEVPATPVEIPIFAGMPIGLLLLLTYAEDDITGAWTNLKTTSQNWSSPASSGISWTGVAAPTTIWSEVI